ncbi:MAG: glycosyltransferase family 39 protein [Bacteroidia bacterium]|nr:glycosyltransferase family 39 protein [Bacteroidia bacterium]
MRRFSPDLMVLLLLAAGGFLGFLGQPPLFDWDEINFAEAAREMLATGNYLQVQINYQPFWEKPPLFFWMQALSMSWFGVGEYAARFPNAVIGIFTILALYREGSAWRNALFGRLVALFYLATMLPSIYFKTGIIDPTFNFFIFLGLMNIFHYDEQVRLAGENKRKDKAAWIAGVWIGLAVLTKGPVALVVVGLIYGIYKGIWHKMKLPWLGIFSFSIGCFLTIGVWYGVETVIHGSWFITEFISYQFDLFSKDVAGHAQPFYYHPIVFLLGCFPMAAFTFRGMALKGGDDKELLLRRLMIIWFWVVMVLFSIVKTKIIHYSSLLYFPGAFLSADLVYRWIKEGEKPKWDTWLLLGIGAVVWGLAPSLINVATSNLAYLASRLKDPIASAAMTNDVNWSGWEWTIGGVFLLSILFFLLLIYQRKYQRALWLQAVATLVFVNLMFVVVAPKAGEHVQGVPQAFFEKLEGKQIYVLPARYKSYLPYFYSKVAPPANRSSYTNDWLISGDIDKDVYLSVQAHREDEAFRQQFRTFERLYEEGGFVFYVRKKSRPWLGIYP